MENPEGPLRILAIDGGGIRGIIPATVIAHIQGHLKRPVTRLFDALAGTSTGGIIALGLGIGASRDEPRYSPMQLLELYLEHGEEIFPTATDPGFGKPSLFGRGDSTGAIRRLFAPFGGTPSTSGNARYEPTKLEALLKEYFEDARFDELTVEALITSFDMASMQPVIFRSGVEPGTRQLVRDIARATSAAPTYFPPLELQDADRASYLVDGGVWANNPSALAYAAFSEPARETVLVSLGTGHPRPAAPRPYAELITRAWPLVAGDILQVGMTGSGAGAHILLTQLASRIPSLHYFRLDIELTGGAALDDVSPANLKALQAVGAQLIEDEAAQLSELMALIA